MKTRNNLALGCKPLFLLIFLTTSVSTAQDSQKKSSTTYELPSKLPSDLKLVEDEPQRYRLQTIWHNRDLNGNVTGKFIIRGDYTRGLGNGQVRWNNVKIEVCKNPDWRESETIVVKSMEGFSYKSPHDIAKPNFFKHLPTDETKHLLRTLVWDAVALEAFAWQNFHKLELNKAVKSSEFENRDVQMADWGTLNMKGLNLKWTGITKVQDESCAIIQYKSFVNPIASGGNAGRSLYWGDILVSLIDKQIEHATMNEDVIMKITTPDVKNKIINIQREVSLEKIVDRD